MATSPNWGKGRNLKVAVFEDADHDAVVVLINDWLLTLAEAEILEMWFTTQEEFGGGGGEANHCFILYTEE